MRLWIYNERFGPGVIIGTPATVAADGKPSHRINYHLWGSSLEEMIRRADELAPGALSEAIPDVLLEALREYFNGGTVDPAQWPVDFSGVRSPFAAAVYRATRGIGRGRAATYGEIAAAAGSPGAARAVGTALGRNPAPLFVPCHRVRARGGPGGWSGPPGWKDRLVALERMAI